MLIVTDSQSKQLDLESIGIKGAALRHLRSLRLYVPRFVVLTSEFFEALAEKSGFAQKARFAAENITERDELAREFERLLSSFTYHADLISTLDEPLHDLAGQGALRVVARPSRPYMSKIDSRHHLNLASKAEVIDAITSIFKEHFSPEAVSERLSKDLPAVHVKLPIILQVFIKPDVTGIVMPYRSRQGFYYITAWKGFGFELDFHTADHYLVNYRDLMLERFLNNTSGDMVFFEESSGSITRTKILHEEAKRPFLDHDQIIEMCKLYAEHASDLGGLAIEFKIKGTDLYFISLKDANILDRAERALDELRNPSAKPAPHIPEPQATSEPVIEEPAPPEEPIHVEPERSSPAHEDQRFEPKEAREPVRSEPEPNVPLHEATVVELVEEDEAALDAVPEVSHGERSDHAAIVSRFIRKYIEINPALERQFRLLEQDLLDEFR